MFLCLVEIFNDKLFVEKLIHIDLNLRLFRAWVLEYQCEAAGKLVDIGQQKARSCEGREMGTVQFRFLFRKGLPVKLKEMGMERVLQGLRT